MGKRARIQWVFVAAIACLLASSCRRPNGKVSIEVCGSTTIEPFMRKAASVFAAGRNLEILVTAPGSKQGIERLVRGQCDIAMSSTEITADALVTAEQSGVKVKSFLLGYDLVVPIVNKSNPLESIGMSDLKDIFAGRTRNWKALGGADLPIAVVARDAFSGTSDIWTQHVTMSPEHADYVSHEVSNSAVLAKVAANEGAIGYVSIAFLNADVKALLIGGKPLPGHHEHAIDYPVKRPLFLYVNEDRFRGAGHLRRFVLFLLMTQEGHRTLTEFGFHPAEPHGL